MGPRHSSRRARPVPATGGAAQPNVDLGPLAESVGYRLQRAQLVMRSAVVATLAEVDLSPGRFGVLSVIERNPGLSQADACAALGIQPTAGLRREVRFDPRTPSLASCSNG